MNESEKLNEQREKIVRGLELTYKRLIKFKKDKNSPLIVSRNGEVVELDPTKVRPSTKYKWH